MAEEDNVTFYEKIGGSETIGRIIETFYPKVISDPLIGPLFPENIRPVMEKQFMFLTQLFGGPHLYSDHVGHPMMRARHLPFEITVERAEAWLGCMRRTIQEIGMEPGLQDLLMKRLNGLAYHFVNTP